MALKERRGADHRDKEDRLTVTSHHSVLVGLEGATAEVVIQIADVELVVQGENLRDFDIKRGRVELSDLLARSRAAKLAVPPRNTADLDTEDRDYYDSIGPWARGSLVAQKLGRTMETLGNYRRKNELLGVGFGKKPTYYYPVQQFKNGQVIPGLTVVLDALSVGFAHPESQAGWLAGEAYEEIDKTRWDVLRDGEVDLVVSWAREDAGHIAAA